MKMLQKGDGKIMVFGAQKSYNSCKILSHSPSKNWTFWLIYAILSKVNLYNFKKTGVYLNENPESPAIEVPIALCGGRHEGSCPYCLDKNELPPMGGSYITDLIQMRFVEASTN